MLDAFGYETDMFRLCGVSKPTSYFLHLYVFASMSIGILPPLDLWPFIRLETFHSLRAPRIRHTPIQPHHGTQLGLQRKTATPVNQILPNVSY